MSKILILSGAGISAESGINTFRDSDGLWEGHEIAKVAQIGVLETNRAEAIEFYDKRRLDIKNKEPNKAHKVIAKLKSKYPKEISIITQNVDNLFEKAGLESKEIVHLHGFLTEVRCEQCNFTYDIGYKKIGEDSFNGKCPKCYSKKIRPNIVMFGEEAPNYRVLNNELNDCELLVVIGTSGNVLDVTAMAKYIPNSILNNLEKSDAIDDSVFNKTIYNKATEAICDIEKEIELFLKI